jgi:hypothetical protein
MYVSCFDGPVTVYDLSSLSHLSNLSIPDLGCVQDMTTCPQCDVVYILDRCNRMIHVVDEDGFRIQWTVGDWPAALSVNSQLNVVVTFARLNKLRVFNSSGQLANEITLEPDILVPDHAIQLDNDHYAVVAACGMNLFRVSIVNGSGTIVESYEENLKHNLKTCLMFRMLLIGESLIVLDYFNYRLVLFKVSPLIYVRELVSTRSENLQPWRMTANENGTRLVVSFFSLIRVFDIVWPCIVP